MGLGIMTYPRLVVQTDRAAYWEVTDGIYQATKGPAPTNEAGYRSLLAIMQQKGEPWEFRLPYMVKARTGEKP